VSTEERVKRFGGVGESQAGGVLETRTLPWLLALQHRWSRPARGQAPLSFFVVVALNRHEKYF
jgi:hypothetical protein